MSSITIRNLEMGLETREAPQAKKALAFLKREYLSQGTIAISGPQASMTDEKIAYILTTLTRRLCTLNLQKNFSQKEVRLETHGSGLQLHLTNLQLKD